jgi:hypothetical protein
VDFTRCALSGREGLGLLIAVSAAVAKNDGMLLRAQEKLIQQHTFREFLLSGRTQNRLEAKLYLEDPG